MPLTLQKIAARRASVSFDYAGESVTVDYYPEQLTMGLQTRVTELRALAERDEDAAKRAIGAIVLQLVASWDVLIEDSGPPIPLDADALFAVSPDFLGHVIVAIVQDAGQGEASGARQSGPSASRSSQAAPQAPSRRQRRTGTP
jgi:hypothetical protein